MPPRRRSATARAATLYAATACLILTAPSSAATISWDDPNGGGWSSTTNWDSGTVPGDLDVAVIALPGPLSVTYAHNYGAVEINGVTLSPSSGTLTVTQSSSTSTLNTATFFLGRTGTGHTIWNQSAGTVNSRVATELGYQPGAAATYSLSGTGTLAGAYTMVGDQGSGTFNQSGGAHNIDDLYVGGLSGGIGTYSLTGGTVTSANTSQLGADGTATFLHSAGSHSVNTSLILGYYSTGTGTYSLSSTGALSAGSTTVGRSGRATFTQSGGTHTLSGNLLLGQLSTGNGTYNLSGGTLSVGDDITVGVTGAATFSHSGGAASAASLTLGLLANETSFYTLSAAGALAAPLQYVGKSGVGTFTHTGGTNTSTDEVYIGYLDGATGSYVLSNAAARLDSVNTAVGNNGIGAFTHSAGTHTVLSLNIGTGSTSTGTYSLSSTGFLSTTNTALGWQGAGTFNQSGGTHTLSGTLRLAQAATATASYTLSGGTLASVASTLGESGSATFFQSGGTHTTTTLSLGSQVAGTGTYNLTAGGLTASTANLGGISSGARGAGVLNISGSGTATVGGTLNLWNTPGTALNLAGGTLNVNNFVLSHNPGAFHWTGGTLNFTNGYTINALNLGPSLTVPNTATLSSPVASTNDSLLTLAGGTLSGTGGLTNRGTLNGYGRVSTNVLNEGILSQSGGPLAFSSTTTLTNTGTVTLANGLTATLAVISNSGLFDLNNAYTTASGTLTNNIDGVLTGAGTLSGSLVNNGTITLDAGTTRLPGFTSSGLIQLTGPTANLATYVGGAGTLTNAGTLEGHGIVSLPVVNNGTLEPTAGTLRTTASLANNAAGKIRIGDGDKLLATGPFPTTAGSILLTGGTLDTNNQPLTNTGTITAAAGISTLAAPLTNASPGKTIVSGNSTATFTHPVTNQAGSEFRVSAGSTAVFLAPVTGVGLFTGTGSKFFESGASSPGFLATTGSTTVQQPASLTTSYLNESSLTSYGPTTLLPNSPQSTLGTLNLTTTGTLDLTNNTLLVSSTPASLIRNYLSANQLFSSTSDPNDSHSLGYLQTPAGILVKLTLTGDANLDGQLNPDDFALLDRGSLTSGSLWQQGDFNYDGSITPADYLLLDSTYAKQQGGQLSPSFLAQRQSQFGTEYVSQLLVAIPEPSTALLTSVLCHLTSSRKRRRRPL